jgi:DNA repair protein RadC
VSKCYNPKDSACKSGTGDYFDSLAKPAQRALANAGINTLKQLSKLSEEELSSLHGIGPNAIKHLKKALSELDLSFVNKKK